WEDQDRKRRRGTANWTDFQGTGPYTVTLTITGGPASWDSKGSGTTVKTFNSLETGNVFLFADDMWPDGQTITVVAKAVDNAPNPAPPDVGSTKDADFSLTWTIVKRTQCPTTMTTNANACNGCGPPNVFRANPALYAYDMGPALPPPLIFPYYANQTILESFSAVSAYQFTLASLLPAFKMSNPTLTTPDAVANFLFGTGNNGTFVIDNQDRIYDQHGRPALQTGVFTVDALNTGVGYVLPQTYSCGPNAVKSYTITTLYQGANITINKSGP
ncbi:MAG: hypothetical protein KGN84_03700, partial [Acidobacteriota bacterium]|nr:hypothetical protein [Acidobacteriota bacterium]